VIEHDWGDSVKVGAITLITTPAQHFSGRSLFDEYSTLWASWVIKTPTISLFFSGDSGYFSGFKRIGKEYGPFDMSFMELGAYNVHWKEMHMMPKESVQVHIDIGARVMFPIHNGTFDLALHSWHDPFDQAEQIARERNISIRFPKMGEALSILQPSETDRWW
jgi:L-ascorbate metabolism protein UlaG (beta-lactamase superfamily)